MSATPPRGLIGVVHLEAMPGDPAFAGAPGDFAACREAALRDARALLAGGADAIIVENFGSAPFPKGTAGERLPPHQVAQLALVVGALRELSPDLPVGVNCLRNDAVSAVGIAAACDAAFLRINVHSGAYVTDQGVIEGEAHRTLRYRSELGARCAIAADVLVKHAAPLVPIEPEHAVSEVLERGRADAVIVTGAATGAPVDRALLERVRGAAGSAPVWVGSGLQPDNAAELAPLADAAIVGTWLKRGGDVRAPVDEERVRRLVKALRAAGW